MKAFCNLWKRLWMLCWLFPDGTRNWKQIEGTRTMDFDDDGTIGAEKWDFIEFARRSFGRPNSILVKFTFHHTSRHIAIFGKRKIKYGKNDPIISHCLSLLFPLYQFLINFQQQIYDPKRFQFSKISEDLNRSKDELNDRSVVESHSSKTDKLRKVIHFNKSHSAVVHTRLVTKFIWIRPFRVSTSIR